jgi:hypothetical protein
MSDAKNTIEQAKISESNKFSQEFEIQLISMLERLIPKEVQKVEVVKPARKQGAPRIDRGITTATVKSDAGNPDIEITNPFDRPARIMGITLIPDSSFKTKGILQLDIARAPYFTGMTAADFTDISTFSIPISDDGYEIDANETVEIYIWTSDGTGSALTAVVHFEA